MSGVPLFIEPGDEGIPKMGMEARLSDKADEWPHEILQEAMKQHPYLGQYDVSPIMREVEDERGYALGFLTVRNKTTRLNTQAGQQLAQDAGVRTIKVPVIVKEQRLKDLYVFQDSRGRSMPLNEFRVKQALFRPDLIDSWGRPPENVTMIGDQLIPPDRSERMTSGRGAIVEQGEVKTSAARPELLIDAIAPTILQSDIDRMTTALNEDQILAHSLIKGAAGVVLQKIASVEPMTVVDTAEAVLDAVEPNVAQLHRYGDTYMLKLANHAYYNPVVYEMDRIKAASALGEDAVAAADQNGVATLSDDSVVKEDLTTGSRVEKIERFGQYKVRDATDKEHIGIVFPSVVDFDGTQLPMAVFTNGSAHAIQSEIAGSPVASGTNLISGDKLEGDGFFYMLTQDGSAVAFTPGTISHTYEDKEGPGIGFEPVSGGKLKLRLTAGLKKPVHVGGGEYGIPASVQWCPMEGPALTLASEPTAFLKTAASLNRDDLVTIISDGSVWSFAGTPVEKLASEDRQFIPGHQAMFVASCLGMDPNYALKKLARAGQTNQPVEVHGCRQIVPLSERLAEAQEFAKEATASMPPKYLLLKEAAGLNDVNTVDKVLSLGFLTPENVATFVDFLPDMEEALQKLAYLLIAVRLGLPDVPENSVKSSMERLEEVCQSLKELVYRKA